LGGADDQPDHRRVPRAPAGADPHAALARARRDRVSGAAATRRRPRTRRRARNHGAEPRDQEPDSRRQGAPDLFDDADRAGEARDADDEPVPLDAVSETADFARVGDERLVVEGRTRADHRAGRGCGGRRGHAEAGRRTSEQTGGTVNSYSEATEATEWFWISFGFQIF